MLQKWVECKIDKTVTVSGFYSALSRKFINNYSFKGEEHDFWELVTITSGNAIITSAQNIYILNEGEAFLHKPLEFHRIYSNNNPFSFIVITFGMSAMPKLNNYCFKLSEEQTQNLQNIFEDMQKQFVFDRHLVVSKKTNTEFAIEMLVHRFEMHLLSLFHDKKIIEKTNVDTVSSKNYSLIISTMIDNICKNINLKELATLCGMSVSSISKTVFLYSGTSPKNYYNRLRTIKATQLLSSGLSVQDTSDELGFLSANHFSVFYKRHTGIPPFKVKNNNQ